jgi:hypothetical protein
MKKAATEALNPSTLKHERARGEHEESVSPFVITEGSSEEPLTVAKSRPNQAAAASLTWFFFSVEGE